jgi:hypothetical protein
VTPAELSQAVREAFAYAASYVAVIAGNNPTGTAAFVLGRPDVDAVLQQSLDAARELAQDAVREAWHGPEGAYLEWLLADVARQYAALTLLRADVRAAWNSVPQAAFVPGVTPPGVNPTTEAGQHRAEAIRQAILGFGSSLALRSRLTAEVAGTASATVGVMAGGEEQREAGEVVYKQWLCSSQPPDERTCPWCCALNGIVVPLHTAFPSGEPADLTGHGRLTRPPRWYRGWLQGPPRHPRCRCRIVIITPPEGVASEAGGQGASPGGASPGAGAGAPRAAPGFLAAADIRALPEARYQALMHFLGAATLELEQALARLRTLGSSQ